MNIELTKDGYLADLHTWNQQVAEFLAQKQNIVLTSDHWEILYLLRDFYAKYHASPSVRTLVNAAREAYGPDKGNSIYLHNLFPGGVALQANNIAGLPKPLRCI